MAKGLQNLRTSYSLALSRINKSDLILHFRSLSRAFLCPDFPLSQKSEGLTSSLFAFRCCGTDLRKTTVCAQVYFKMSQ